MGCYSRNLRNHLAFFFQGRFYFVASQAINCDCVRLLLFRLRKLLHSQNTRNLKLQKQCIHFLMRRVFALVLFYNTSRVSRLSIILELTSKKNVDVSISGCFVVFIVPHRTPFRALFRWSRITWKNNPIYSHRQFKS